MQGTKKRRQVWDGQKHNNIYIVNAPKIADTQCDDKIEYQCFEMVKMELIFTLMQEQVSATFIKLFPYESKSFHGNCLQTLSLSILNDSNQENMEKILKHSKLSSAVP